MAITGLHTLLYTAEPEALRAMPSAEMGVHPGGAPAHQLSFMCDDLAATIAELRDRGIEFRGEPVDEGFGIVIRMVLPGDVEVQLYEPRHPTAV